MTSTSTTRQHIGTYTPMSRRLFEAVKNCRMAQIKILVLTNRMNINTKDANGENCLIEALRIQNPKKRYATFLFLLKCGIDIHNRDVTERDALEWAVKLNCTREALLLLNGPMIEYDFLHRDTEGLTLLHHATINNMEEVVKTVVKRLKRYHISVDIADSLQYTPYLHAQELDHKEIMNILAAAGASTHVQKRSDNCSVIRHAVDDSNAAFLMKLKFKQKLPPIKRTLTACKNQRAPDQLDIASNISSLLQLKSDGRICERFVASSTAFTESPDAVVKPILSSNTSMVDLQEIFEIVSEQMSLSFCKPAQKPKPKAIVFHHKKPTLRPSALAAIMSKPVHRSAAGRQKPHLVRKSSRNDFQAKSKLRTVLPSIKVGSK